MVGKLFTFFWHHLFMHTKMILSKISNLYTTMHALTCYEWPVHLIIDLESMIYSHGPPLLLGVKTKKILNPTSYAIKVACHVRDMDFRKTLSERIIVHTPSAHLFSQCLCIYGEGLVRSSFMHLISFIVHHFDISVLVF